MIGLAFGKQSQIPARNAQEIPHAPEINPRPTAPACIEGRADFV
jgi:hypothetical protein